MRILQTGDWHLGHFNDKHDRSDDLFAQVQRICDLTLERKVDVLLVAGDVFDRRRRVDEMTKRLADMIKPYVQQGLHVILVPGNHDDREHFRMMRSLLNLEKGQPEGQTTQGQVHIIQTREIVKIDGVQFAIIPYPIPEALEPYRVDAVGAGNRNVVLSTAYADLVRSFREELEPDAPVVYVMHINVAGVTTPSERELTYDDDIRLGREDLPLDAAYIALGHIHQAQSIKHPVPCWYAGSIERLNMGERHDDKRILIVDVPSHGHAQVEEVPLDATPFYDIRIPSAELESLSESYKDIHSAFIRLHLECKDGDDPVALQHQARSLYLRCIDVSYSGIGTALSTATLPECPTDYRTTVMNHVRETYANAPDLSELEVRTNHLLQEVVDAAATN
jgi:exonuclease SbcD